GWQAATARPAAPPTGGRAKETLAPIGLAGAQGEPSLGDLLVAAPDAHDEHAAPVPIAQEAVGRYQEPEDLRAGADVHRAIRSCPRLHGGLLPARHAHDLLGQRRHAKGL